MEYDKKESVACPFCNMDQLNGEAGDYVYPGLKGYMSAAPEKCELCDELFVAKALHNGKVQIRKGS